MSANAADPAIGADLGTGHFLLYVEVLDAEETGRFLEATYAEMKRFFADVEPDRKLQVKIYATKERYQLEMDRLRRVFSVKRKARDTHGLYLRETACAYLYLQPEEYETRKLLVHEVAHEYHDAIRPWSKVPSLAFCDEGIAEYFSLHDWDGQRLRLGIVPPIAKLDYAKAALRQLQNNVRFDLESVVAGDTEVDYPLAWGLVSFLVDQHRPKFDTWRQGINNDVDPRVVWQKQFGPVTPELLKSFEAWLQSRVCRWEVISGEWSPAGDGVEGIAREDEFAMAILDQPSAKLAITFDPSRSNTICGAVFGFRGARNYHVLQHCPDGHWDLMHFEGTYFPKEQRRSFPARSGAVSSISVEPGERVTTLTFDELTVGVTNVAGYVGLWVKEGRMRFPNPSISFATNSIDPVKR
ncbi:MAG TPA: hypothetical protein VNH84_04435 [Candidatus Saccharimonadales bacterium]|nr:hypothetical protein [Candidatus Saccharimonadales bacterium]